MSVKCPVPSRTMQARRHYQYQRLIYRIESIQSAVQRVCVALQELQCQRTEQAAFTWRSLLGSLYTNAVSKPNLKSIISNFWLWRGVEVLFVSTTPADAIDAAQACDLVPGCDISTCRPWTVRLSTGTATGIRSCQYRMVSVNSRRPYGALCHTINTEQQRSTRNDESMDLSRNSWSSMSFRSTVRWCVCARVCVRACVRVSWLIDHSIDRLTCLLLMPDNCLFLWEKKYARLSMNLQRFVDFTVSYLWSQKTCVGNRYKIFCWFTSTQGCVVLCQTNTRLC